MTRGKATEEAHRALDGNGTVRLALKCGRLLQDHRHLSTKVSSRLLGKLLDGAALHSQLPQDEEKLMLL